MRRLGVLVALLGCAQRAGGGDRADAGDKGYRLVAGDGGVFASDAPFRGPLGGGVFDFSDENFAGSIPSLYGAPSAPVIGLAAFTA